MNAVNEKPLRRITWRVFVDMITPGAVLLSALNPAMLGVILALEHSGKVDPLLTVILLLIPAAPLVAALYAVYLLPGLLLST